MKASLVRPDPACATLSSAWPPTRLVNQPEHALHCLEVTLAVRLRPGRAIRVDRIRLSALDYQPLPAGAADSHRRKHDPRSV
jgi:hypothetical protein